MAPPALDPVIHQATRLRILALLARNRDAPFTWVRDQLELTDGNLSSHAGRLADAGYIEQGRVLTPAGFQVRLRLTREGNAAFGAYTRALRELLAAPAVEEDGQARAESVTSRDRAAGAR